MDILLCITSDPPEDPVAISSEIDCESSVAVRRPEGAELRESLGGESLFSVSISSWKLSQKYGGNTWDNESSGPSDPWLPYDMWDKASNPSNGSGLGWVHPGRSLGWVGFVGLGAGFSFFGLGWVELG